MTNIKLKITVIGFLFLFLNVFGQKTELGYKTKNYTVYSEDKDEYILKINFSPGNYNSDKEYKNALLFRCLLACRNYSWFLYYIGFMQLCGRCCFCWYFIKRHSKRLA